MKESRQMKVKLKATNAHPYIPEGKIFEVHPAHKDDLFKKKWAVEIADKDTKPEGAAVPASHNTNAEPGTPEVAATTPAATN